MGDAKAEPGAEGELGGEGNAVEGGEPNYIYGSQPGHHGAAGQGC